MILGLDVSTSITGATVIDLNGNVVYCEAWDTRKIKNFFDKASFINNKLVDIRIKFPITKIVIEQSLQMFRAGFSSAKTLTLLSKFNGVVSWGVKILRGQKAKQVVLKFVLDNVDGFEVEYTRSNNPKPGSYDRADSYIIARAGYLECQNTKN